MEEKKKIIITDSHFGKYNNSINFLNSQLKAYDQLKDYIETSKQDEFDLIHLGDLFDSRSTISMYTLNTVKELLISLNYLIKKRNPRNRFIFVAGNHDFFSPTSDTVNSLDTIIRSYLPDAVIYDRYCGLDNGDMYIPWYQMNGDYETLRHAIDISQVKNIFTHCDCKDFNWNKIPPGINVYSGHIHIYHEYPNMIDLDNNSKLYNLSPPYALDWGDSNDNKKGIWILENGELSLIENKDSIRYRTFVNEQIFDIPDLDDSIERGDNFRLYISEENRPRLDYIERINELTTDIKYLTVILVNNSIASTGEIIESLDINNMIDELIPEHLKDCFDIIKKEVNEG